MSKDTLYRLIIPSLNLRAYAALTLDTARDICRVHNTTPNATAGLGKSITAAVLMSSSLKPQSKQSLSYKIQGSGPLSEVNVQVDALGNVRGYTSHPRVDEEADLGRIEFAKAIGAGLLTVTKDLGHGEPYSGVSHLVRGEIAIDTAYYLTVSEQVPSALILALTLDEEGTISSSGGIMFQSFPDTPASAIELVERNIAAPKQSLGHHLLAGNDILSYVSDLADGAAIDIISTIPVQHRCRCDKMLILTVLKTLKKEDIEEMIEKDGGAQILCTFCSTEHRFTKEELNAVLAEM